MNSRFPVRGLLALALLAGAARADDSCMEHRIAALPLLADDADAVAGFDEATGRDLRNFPPSPVADYKHMRLDLTIQDMNTPRAAATQALTLRALRMPVAQLTLDAVALQIASVTPSKGAATFTHDGTHLTVTLDPPLAPGEEITLTTSYEINNPPAGLFWTPESPAWPGRPAQIHTQGQPEDNRHWFPIHDFPNDRLTTEMLVTVPAGYLVSSNGRLVEKTSSTRETSAGVKPFETFHWLQDKDHVSYLVTLVVGKFDVVDVTDDPKLTMPVYVPQGRGGDVVGTYGNTARMVRFFEKRLEEPYPWHQYAQLVVHNFTAGGMENTSATTMYDTALMAKADLEDNDLDGLIAHELIHQWFGDLITTNSWEHIWLNEGFATYFQKLWFEERDGRDHYDAEIQEAFDSVIAADTVPAPRGVGMASKVYSNPWEAFRRPANPYPKGASVLHMLRVKLGDQVFFDALARYVDTHKHTTVETPDLRKIIEALSGESLEQFFWQWTTRPGIPRLDIAYSWDEAASSLTTTIVQTQQIDGDNPAFEFTLPLFIAGEAAQPGRIESIDVRGRSVSSTIKLDSKPRFVAADPRLGLLAEFKITQDQAATLAQLEDGPTLASRVQAARTLARAATLAKAAGQPLSNDVRKALLPIALDPKQPIFLRVEAAKALARCGDDVDLLSLSGIVADHWEVRQAAIDGLGSYFATKAASKDADRSWTSLLASVLENAATSDSSVRVRAAAIRTIGSLGLIEQAGVVTRSLAQASQHDLVRQAAINAAADLAGHGLNNVAESIAPFTRNGTISRTRPTALAALVRVARREGATEADRTLAFESLVACVRDGDLRARRSAWSGLVELGDFADGRSAKLLETLANEARTPAQKAELQRLHKALVKKAAEAAK